MLNEADLIAAAHRGEVSAFEALVLRYQDLVLRVAYLITGDAQTAEDVAQEGFMKAYRALPHFRRGAPVRPWLLRIIANEAKNHQRAAARRERLTLQVAALGTGGVDSATPEESALASEQRVDLPRFDGHLYAWCCTTRGGVHMAKTHPPYPPEFRSEAIRLVRGSGQSAAAIARRLEVSTETLRLWVRQAEIDDGVRHDGLTTEETEEVRRLRREVRTLREEREIVVKAAAFFAKETTRTRL